MGLTIALCFLLCETKKIAWAPNLGKYFLHNFYLENLRPMVTARKKLLKRPKDSEGQGANELVLLICDAKMAKFCWQQKGGVRGRMLCLPEPTSQVLKIDHH